MDIPANLDRSKVARIAEDVSKLAERFFDTRDHDRLKRDLDELRAREGKDTPEYRFVSDQFNISL